MVEVVLRGDTSGLCVVCGAVCVGSGWGGAGVWPDVCGVYVSDVWVSASEWVCDRAAIHGEFAACAGDCDGVDGSSGQLE